MVEKWFLDAVESKLNRGKNRMQEFQSILEKYVGQYKDNKYKMKRRDAIEQGRICKNSKSVKNMKEQQKENENRKI